MTAILNWNNLDLNKINFSSSGSVVSYTVDKKRYPLVIMVDNLSMPFGINDTALKTNIKFKINGFKFTEFLHSLDEKIKSLRFISNNLEYRPLLKKFNNDYFFLATIGKTRNIEYSIDYGDKNNKDEGGEEEVTELEFLRNNKATDIKIRAVFNIKYIWIKNNCYGITLTVSDLTIYKEKK